MNYKLSIHPKALKEIQKLPQHLILRIEKKIDNLLETPRPNGYKKLTNFESDRSPNEDCYRIRIGNIRVIYTIQDQIVTVTIIQVQKRGDIY